MHPITAEGGLALLLSHCRGAGSTAPGSILKGKGEDVGETQVRFQRKGFQVHDSVHKEWPQWKLFATTPGWASSAVSRVDSCRAVFINPRRGLRRGGATPQRLPAQTLSGFEPKRPLNQAQTRNRKDGEARQWRGTSWRERALPMAGVGFLRQLEDRAEPPTTLDPRGQGFGLL